MNWFFSPSVPTGHLPRQREARRGVEGAAPYILNLWRGGMGDVAGDQWSPATILNKLDMVLADACGIIIPHWIGCLDYITIYKVNYFTFATRQIFH